MKIIYDDDFLVVAEKPFGVISQNSNDNNNMVFLLSNELNCEIFPVHRLDRETGGVMVFAKDAHTAAILSRQITEHALKKEYIALAHNEVTPNSAELCDLLFRDAKANKSYVVKRERRGVKKAVLSYEKCGCIDTKYGLISILKIKLKTGRTHQIRVQFSSRGHSLLGDRRYGGRDDARILGLWSYKLGFIHPKTNKFVEFISLPENNEIFTKEILEKFNITN